LSANPKERAPLADLAALQAVDLSVCLGDRPVLQDINLNFAPGQIVGVVGPNGSGKTTLLRALARLISYSGALSIAGHSVDGCSLRQLAQWRTFVAAQALTPVPYRVGALVNLGRASRQALFHPPYAATVVQQALAAVHLEHLTHRLVAQLSMGEQHLVRLAQAIATEASLWLLDEPCSHLDLRHQAHLLQLLQRRRSQGHTTVLSLHDLSLAGRLCDHVVLLHKGRVAHVGTPAQVLTVERLQPVFATALVCRPHPTSGAPCVELAWPTQQ
jgi:iron complex transport system ATP-binding protein